MTPDTFTNQELQLDVGDGHQLYVHDWGNRNAKLPIFFLHGGPGGNSKDGHKQYFVPEKQRVIFHDQRGTGKSTPYGSLEHNTTQDLISDITKIAAKLGIDRFIITGGSWGSCLALAFAVTHPDKVGGMVLHGIFTGTQDEINWLDKGRFQHFFPDAWDAYLEATPVEHRNDPSSYHSARILGDDLDAAKESALIYETLEGSVMSLDDRHMAVSGEDYDPTGIRLETFYMANRCFLKAGHIADNAASLTMPIYLVQGRYDMVCPPATAYKLHKELPSSELIMTVSGHRGEHETWNLVRTLLLQLTA